MSTIRDLRFAFGIFVSLAVIVACVSLAVACYELGQFALRQSNERSFTQGLKVGTDGLPKAPTGVQAR